MMRRNPGEVSEAGEELAAAMPTAATALSSSTLKSEVDDVLSPVDGEGRLFRCSSDNGYMGPGYGAKPTTVAALRG